MNLPDPRMEDAFHCGLSFADPSLGPLTHCDFDPSQNAGGCIVRRVPIRDARKLGETSLDREGFKLLHQPSRVADFDDEERVRSEYYPEAAEIIRRHTGAKDVRILSHAIRTESRPMEGPYRLPATYMHNDYNTKAALEALGFLLTPEEQGRLLSHRYVEINLWRPIRGPVRTKPLALADGSSLTPEDFIVGIRRTVDGENHEYLTLRYRPDQRWYYYPDMLPDEALLLKCYDSDPSRMPHGGHGAMEDSLGSPDAPPRETVEIRAFAFFAPNQATGTI